MDIVLEKYLSGPNWHLTKRSRIRETLNLSACADSSSNSMRSWREINYASGKFSFLIVWGSRDQFSNKSAGSTKLYKTIYIYIFLNIDICF